METTAVATVGDIISSSGDVFSTAIGWVGTVASTIVNNPIILVFALIPLVGLGIGLFKRIKG